MYKNTWSNGYNLLDRCTYFKDFWSKILIWKNYKQVLGYMSSEWF